MGKLKLTVCHYLGCETHVNLGPLHKTNTKSVKRIVQVQGPKKWLILGVNLTQLVENRNLSFLEV